MGVESKMQQYADARAAVLKESPARKRLISLFDEGSFVEVDPFARAGKDGAGVLTGYGTVAGNPVCAFSQDVEDADGAVGRIHGAKLRKLYDLALKAGAPVVGIYDSKGARVSEGNDALAAYGEMLAAANNLSGVVPQVSLVLGVCAGTSAMLACSADFVVMSEQAQFFMTSPFTAKANGEAIDDAGTAKAAMKSGVASIVKDGEEEAIDAVRLLISMLPLNNISEVPAFEFSAPGSVPAEGMNGTALLEAVADAQSTLELQQGFGAGATTALCTIGGTVCGAVSTNGNPLDRDGCAKIARFVSVCDSFRIPVVTFLDSCGMKQSAADEVAGGIRDMARLAHVYAEATTAKVCVITGAAYGPAYIAMAGKGSNADLAIAWPSAVISALKPETAVAFLYSDEISETKSRDERVQEYKAQQGSAFQAAADGAIEDIVEPAQTRNAVLAALDILSGKRVTRLPKKHSNLPL